MKDKKTKSTNETRPVLYVEDVPEDIRIEFKAACVLRKTTMKEELIQFMKSFAQRR